MGNHVEKLLLPHLWKEDEPDSQEPLKYDPQFGFKEPRKPKVTTATEIEMDSANLPEDLRNECAYFSTQYLGCLWYNAPMWVRCKGLKDEWDHCSFKEYIHDMKEFEREKRLNARERRIREKQNLG